MTIKEMIDEAGFKHIHFARKFGIKKAHFSLMLSGERTMPEEVKKEIIKACQLQLQA